MYLISLTAGWHSSRLVLILILMEQCIWYLLIFSYGLFYCRLNPYSNGTMYLIYLRKEAPLLLDMPVLILILMEQCIWWSYSWEYHAGTRSLNPYSNGTMYLMNWIDDNLKSIESVLILILMEQCIWLRKLQFKR